MKTYIFLHGFWTTGVTYSKGESFHLLWFGSITAYKPMGTFVSEHHHQKVPEREVEVPEEGSAGI